MFTWMKLRPLAFLSALALTGAAQAQVDRSGWQAELSTLSHDVRGVVTVVDSDTIRVDNFYYDGLGLAVYFTLADGNSNSAFSNGLLIGNDLVGTVFQNDSLIIDLPPGESTSDYRAVSVWCETAGANFGSGLFEHPRTGWEADLVTMAHAVDGIVTIVDHDTIRIDDFDYDGAGFEVYVILAPENTNAAIANGLRVSDNLIGTPLSGASITYDLPPGETVDGYDAVGVWCAVISQNFGSGEFESVFSLDPGTVQAGLPAEFRYSGATPNQPIVTAYSLVGAGPTNTAIGLVDLSQPIRRLPNTLATANGGGLLRVPVPSGSVGVDVWIQAYDLNSARLSPVVMRTVQ